MFQIFPKSMPVSVRNILVCQKKLDEDFLYESREKSEVTETEILPSESDNLSDQIVSLRRENEQLKFALSSLQDKVGTFLSGEQLSVLGKSPKAIAQWSSSEIIRGLKMRFALGKHGYNYLRLTGYPAPSYSTLNRRVECISLDHGLLLDVFELMKTKTANMTLCQRDCVLLVDEMDISGSPDFDTSKKVFVGQTTLGDSGIGTHALVFMLRGLQMPWKQVVAHEVTGPSTKGAQLKSAILKIIETSRTVGLGVRAIRSDMAPCNVSLWRSLDVQVSRKNRQNNFMYPQDNYIYAVADVPHLSKNLRRSGTLMHCIYLPEDLKESEGLTSNKVSSGYIKELWRKEIENQNSLRSLHHLSKDHLFPE